jgi:nitrile hydratase
MKLQHHLGGLEGLDPITPEKRVFVEPWEKTIFAIHAAMMGLSKHLGFKDVPTTFRHEWTWADLRKGAEAMPPFDYFRFRYYEKWLGGVSGWFTAQCYIKPEELEAKTKEFLADPTTAKPTGGDAKIDAQVRHYLATGDSPKRDLASPAKFEVGYAVVVKDVPPSEHTRLPGHLRGKPGMIETVYGGAYTYFCSTGPDGLGEPMPSYCVRFDPADLWNELREPGNSAFYADVFEVYLEPA